MRLIVLYCFIKYLLSTGGLPVRKYDMTKFDVTGMSCAACSAAVERAVNSVDGVTSCQVSLLTNSMNVEGTAASEDIIRAVESAGYGANVKGSAATAASASEDASKPIVYRLVASIVFTLMLMYLSMGHMMWGFPVPSFFEGNHIAISLAELLLSAIVMVINGRFFINGVKGILHRAPNMDTLVAMGSFASFAWSTYALFMMTDPTLTHEYMHELYFESAAMILTLITVGKLLESVSKGKTTDALKGLMELAPKSACVIRDGREQIIPAEEVVRGDVFIVRPGESIPADGIVREGESAVNEAALTGESIPADKDVGDKVSAATINQTGTITCEATGVGEDTALAQIIQMVTDAAATKAPIARIADKIAGIFVPTVVVIALITVIVWLLCGAGMSYALARGISVLVISCPCALGLATPVAIMVGSGVGAKNGILFKNAEALERAGQTQIAVLDKTGTVTSGEPEVTDIIPVGMTEDELLGIVCTLEHMSEHPLAKAVMREGERRSTVIAKAEGFAALPGNGITAVIDGHTVIGGSMRSIGSRCDISAHTERCGQLSDEGKTPLLFALDGVLIGIIAAADRIRDDSADAVRQMHDMGMSVVMLTGDNERTAKVIGDMAGVDEVIAGVLPDGKELVVRKLSAVGRTAMVGDGINDAPALTRADTGIAIGTGTDIAIDSADVVLMRSTLSDVAAAIRLSRATIRNIKQDLFWAFIYNIIGIPLAAGVWIPIFGLKLEPMFGALAMSLSSFCVVSNALRLNLADIHRGYAHRDRVDVSSAAEELRRELAGTTSPGYDIVADIEGMMCEHCEKRVRKAIMALDGVESAVTDYKAGTASVKLSGAVTDDAIISAVTEAGYTVKAIHR